MSRKKFMTVEGEAIWLAHEKKCAYTRELVDVSNFHIDHIIPESLAKDPTTLKDVIAKFDLPIETSSGVLSPEFAQFGFLGK